MVSDVPAARKVHLLQKRVDDKILDVFVVADVAAVSDVQAAHTDLTDVSPDTQTTLVIDNVDDRVPDWTADRQRVVDGFPLDVLYAGEDYDDDDDCAMDR